MTTLRLYGFVISHYTEKVRWALDRSGVDYEDVCLLPGPHLLTTRRLAKETTVPVLVDDGGALQGSERILDRLERTVPGIPRTADRERHDALLPTIDEGFGKGLRTLAYTDLLDRRDIVAHLWTQGGPRWGPALYRLALPGIIRKVRAAYRCTPEGAARAREEILRAVDRVDAELEGRPFLEGEEPGRLDFTSAALLGPLVRPESHPCKWHTEDTPLLSALEAELEGSRTLAHVRRMYADYR